MARKKILNLALQCGLASLCGYAVSSIGAWLAWNQVTFATGDRSEEGNAFPSQNDAAQSVSQTPEVSSSEDDSSGKMTHLVASRLDVHQEADVYIVKRGDTLTGIARQHKMTLATLLQRNRQFQANPDLIFPGDKVYLSENSFMKRSDSVVSRQIPRIKAIPVATGQMIRNRPVPSKSFVTSSSTPTSQDSLGMLDLPLLLLPYEVPDRYLILLGDKVYLSENSLMKRSDSVVSRRIPRIKAIPVAAEQAIRNRPVSGKSSVTGSSTPTSQDALHMLDLPLLLPPYEVPDRFHGYSLSLVQPEQRVRESGDRTQVAEREPRNLETGSLPVQRNMESHSAAPLPAATSAHGPRELPLSIFQPGEVQMSQPFNRLVEGRVTAAAKTDEPSVKKN
jgi:LysM repeat protein